MQNKIVLTLLISSLFWSYGTALTCPAGQYFDANSACSPCPANNACAGGDDSAAAAVPCGVNTEAPAGGATTCTACLPGAQSTSGSACQACIVGQYRGAASSCAAGNCPANNFCPLNPANTATILTPCAAGSDKATAGLAATQAACQACTLGQYSTAGSACSPGACSINNFCPRGTGTNSGVNVLTPCAAGSDKATAGLAATQAACQACTAGQYNTAGTACSSVGCPANNYCPRGTGTNSGVTVLTPCDAGKTSTAGSSVSTACTDCAAGTYGDTAGAGCKDCPANSYCPGGSTITACPTGTSSTAKSTASTDCKASSGANVLGSSVVLLGAAVWGCLTI